MSQRVKIKPASQLLTQRGLLANGRVQKYIDSEVLKRSEPYLPFQQNGLRNSGISGTVTGTGRVIYNAPYARYLYYGKVMIGRAPKQVTSTPLKFHGAPMRGAYWFERMKAVHAAAILQGAKRMAGEG